MVVSGAACSHTTGLFYQGRQINVARTSWQDDQLAPREFFGDGVWCGRHRFTLIDHEQGQPVIRDLQPPNEAERRPVPLDQGGEQGEHAERARGADAPRRLEGALRDRGAHLWRPRVTDVAAHTVGMEKRRLTNAGPGQLSPPGIN